MIVQASSNHCREACEQRSCGRRLVVTATLAALCLISSTGLSAEPRPTNSRGIDVILLIDVSGSMADKFGLLQDNVKPNANWSGWNGSDPNRMRWDAVKLLVDLLDSHDRVLIQRFNEGCPAQFERGYHVGSNPQYFPDGTKFSDPKQDFSLRFIKCGDGQEWDELIKRIGQFNKRLKSPTERKTPYDDGWPLDQGGTNIIGALESVKQAIANEPDRPKQVIILTDGSDQDIDLYVVDPKSYSPTFNSNLGAKLSFLKTAKIPVPVFTVGLNLASIEEHATPQADGKHKVQLKFVKGPNGYRPLEVPIPLYQQTKARAFLKAISEYTAGEFIEAKTATDLLPAYRDLIYRLKGLWQKVEEVAPGTNLSIPITSAVSDFRMLAFVKPVTPTSSKAVTQPPKFAVGSEAWLPARYAKILGVPQLRQGTEEKLYALWYGGNTDPSHETNPFAVIDDEVRWSVPIPDESDQVETTQFKRVPEDFGWPPVAATFYRHQQPTIALVAAKDLLNAQDFEWKLASESAQGAPAQFQAEEKAGKAMQAVFVAGSQVGAAWKSTTLTQDVVWKLSGRGIKPKKSERSPVLDGFTREFPKWTFRVKNELPLRFREGSQPISLSLITATGGCEITTQFDDCVPKIPMEIKFVPPSVSGSPERLPFNLFRVTQLVEGKPQPIAINPQTGGGVFDLHSGVAAIQIELRADQKASLPAGAEYTPGELIFKSAVEDLPEDVELKLPVELAIGRPALQFFKEANRKEPMTTIAGTPTTGSKTTEMLYVAPKDDSGKGDTIRFALEWVNEPVDSDGKKIPFGEQEFRLLDAQGQELPREGKGWELKYADRPVQIALHTHSELDRLAESVAVANLIATGEGFTKGTLKLTWKFKPREVEIKLLDDAVPEIEPGQTVEFRMSGRVTNHAETLEINVADSIRKSGLTFRRTDKLNSKDDFYVTADGFRQLKAIGTADKSDPVSTLTCQISDKVVPGIYEGKLLFDDFFMVDGKRVPVSIIPQNNLTLKLIVDRIQVEVFDPNKAMWIPAERSGIGISEFTVHGWLEEPTHRKLRVTSILGQTISVKDFLGLKAKYALSTDAGRQAIGALELKPLTAAKDPQWNLAFPQFNNRDKNFPFVAELAFERGKHVKQTLRLKLRLLPN